MSQELTNCRKCGEPIIFMPTTKGKTAPVNARTVAIFDEVFDPKKHTSHFATCPHAASFRKPRPTKKKK